MSPYHRHVFRVFISIFILVCFINLFSINAESDYSKYVKIGLFYGSKSLPILSINSANGMNAGFYSDYGFITVCSETTDSPFLIRKDTYFTISENGFKEYNPSSSSIPDGKRLGPYHIKIGGAYQTLEALKVDVINLNAMGIYSFPVYNNEWQLWSEFYTDEASALDAIENNYKNIFGEGQCSVTGPLNNSLVVMDSSGFTKYIHATDYTSLRIVPSLENNPRIINIDDVNYRGEIEIRRFSDSDMTIINVLDVEQYLYGVVPYEMGTGSPEEALKAQAVTARTYTYNNFNKYSKWGFNLCNTTSCQVYKGYDGECADTNKAVDDTAGELVMYEGECAQVFYFSSSGGMTENCENVWSAKLPYLVSVEDNYESGNSYNYNWEQTITASKINSIMNSRGFDLGRILSMQATKYTPAGRVLELCITGTKDSRTYERGGCRTVFSLPSQWYKIFTDSDVFVKKDEETATRTQTGHMKVVTANGVQDMPMDKDISIKGADDNTKTIPATPTSYTLTGRGWGHAIGMSQEGAKGMALNGFTYKYILTHYFTGTTVEKVIQ